MLIAVALLVATLSGIAAVAYANSASSNTSVLTTPQSSNIGTSPFMDNGPMMNGFGCGGQGPRMNPCVSINVSQEFKDNVIDIAKNDTDFQNLLNQGYNVTDLQPIITATVQGDGTVTMKATSAIIMLTQNATIQNTTSLGRALVWVNVDQAKVTRIETMTRTIIENP